MKFRHFSIKKQIFSYQSCSPENNILNATDFFITITSVNVVAFSLPHLHAV